MKRETKTKEQFEKDLIEIYNLSQKLEEIPRLYQKALEHNCSEREEIDEFLTNQAIPVSDEARFAMVLRIVGLSNSGLEEHMKKLNFSKEAKAKIIHNSYEFTKGIYCNAFNVLLNQIQSKELLTTFYRTLFREVNIIGRSMNEFHLIWTNHIINGINPELEKRFEDGELLINGKKAESIVHWLRHENLLDKGHGGEEADRTYSVLVKNFHPNGKFVQRENECFDYESKSYLEAFPLELNEIIWNIKSTISNLKSHEDEIYNQNQQWIDYFLSLITAFSETNVNELVSRWAEVDRAWMKIKTPLQIVHPMEYYEDHYRNAVAPEWDLRIKNLALGENNMARLTSEMFDSEICRIDENKYASVIKFSFNNLEKVQLYIGQPILLYGSCLVGKLSAQVIPNDAIVSAEEGKKIFAFPDRILYSKRNAPFTKFPKEVFEEDFLNETRRFLFNEDELFVMVYNVSTVGHEFGHALWTDEETEIVMNKSGEYKNVEEWKATVGGLITFFYISRDKDFARHVIRDLFSRTITLLARKEISEMRPYYCEGLIHLKILYDIGAISFDGNKIHFDLSEEKYLKIRESYFNTYRELVDCYLEKKDAKEFLYNFAKPFQTSYLPVDEKLKELVLWVYSKYQEFANQLDKSVTKEDYIKKKNNH